MFPSRESWQSGDRGITCIQRNYGLDTSDLELMDRVMPLEGVESGDCFDDHWEYVVITSCEGQWGLRVVSEFDSNREVYPEEPIWEMEASLHCDRRFTTYYRATEELWELGSRTVICVQESFGLDTTDSDRMDRILINAFSLAVGECFNIADIYLEVVSCSSDWDEKVLNAFETEDSQRYPEVSYFDQIAENKCDSQYDYIYYPTQEQWTIGLRTVTCVDEN